MQPPERVEQRAILAASGPAARALIFFGAVVTGAIVSITGYEVAGQRQVVFDQSRRQLASLDIALAEQVERVVAAADFAVADIVVELAEQFDARREPAAEELQRVLRHHAAGLPGIAALSFADAAGRLVAHTRHAGRPDWQSIADRAYFQALLAQPGQGLHIGEPIVGRITGRPQITLSRAVVDGAGRFRGIVIAGVETAYFADFFRDVVGFESGSAALFRTDGVLLARYPEAASGLERVIDGQDPVRRPDAALRGSYRDVDATSRRQRLVSYRTVDDRPLLIATAVDEEALLAGWRAMAWRLGATAAFGIAVVWLLVGAILRRMCVEKSQAERLAQSEQQFRAMVERASDALFLHDPDGRIVMVNRSACDSLGYTAEELTGRHVGTFLPDAEFSRPASLWGGAGVDVDHPVTVETEHRRKDGSTFPVEVRLGAFDMNGRRLVLALARDISERKAYQLRLEQQANYDVLTGLPNRLLFLDRLHTALAAARRSQRPLALLFLDLDGFKNINDTLGHAAGDRLLAESGRRVGMVLREADTVARFGGDEFVVLLPELEGATDGERVAGKIREAFQPPFNLAGRPVVVRPSIGVALYPNDGADADALLYRADQDMYLAKGGGRMKNA